VKKKIFISITIILIVLLILMFTKTSLKTKDMISKEYENFIFYFEEKDSEIINTLNEVLNERYEMILTNLDYNKKEKTEVYIYPNITSFLFISPPHLLLL